MPVKICRDFWSITTYEIGGNHKGQIVTFKMRFDIVHFPWNYITYIIFNTKLIRCVLLIIAPIYFCLNSWPSSRSTKGF